MPPPTNRYPPGTPLTVGSHRISITKYISEGGFAHVYSCQMDPAFNGSSTGCLKRVVVPNKWQLTLLRQEVDAMKRLRGNAHIVSYIDSHASRIPSPNPDAPQQYEVLLLMEYCSGKGLIDFMNQRLTNRLTEPEILSIMGQITTAVAMCHHLSPPLIHRDIKIENVLLDGSGTYKLCDFGSAVAYSPAPSSQQELSVLHNDIMQNTTPQYRAPEMIDLSRGFPIDDKSDIWALGIFLYKLCYYTTPFESPSQKSLQDLSAVILSCSTSLRFPSSPRFSPRLQNVISCCLREDPRRRPNALQLLQEVCLMQGVHSLPDVIPYSVRLAKMNGDRTEKDKKDKSMSEKIRLSEKARSPEKKLPEISSSSALNSIKAKPDDVFSKIDKSKVLDMGKRESKPRPAPRPKSEVFSAKSSSSLKDLIQIHVSESTSGLSDMRMSEEMDRGTLDFLRSKESPATSRQNTGGSIKESIKRGLRRISTGGSLSSQRSGSYKRHEPVVSDEGSSFDDTKKKTSIQMRMQLLLNNKDKKAPKTATGYGKYTDQDDISAINYNSLSANASAESLVLDDHVESFDFGRKPSVKKKSKEPSPEDEKKSHVTKEPSPLPRARLSRTKTDTPPPCPPSLNVRTPQKAQKTPVAKKAQTTPMAKKKAPPPKPSKPSHLKNPGSRRLSTSSETSMPDLDDLEKQFARRFPSYV